MAKKNKPDTRGYVYSTNPDFRFEEEQQQSVTLPPEKQLLRIKLDKRNRAGKAVTLIEHFVGTPSDLEELGKKLKNFCGTGGSAKDGEIIVQGDQRDKVLLWLLRNGYIKSKRI